MGQLTLQNMVKRFGAIEVVKSVSLDVVDGEFMVFVGPSGCGKSTLLRMIAGLEHTSGGDIVIDGKRVNDLPPGQARHRHGLPVLRAVSAYVGL